MIGRHGLGTPNVSAGLGVRERRGLLHHVIAAFDDHVILFVISGIVFLHFCPWVSISLIMCTGGARRPFLHASGSMTTSGSVAGGTVAAAHPGERAACAKSHDLTAGLTKDSAKLRSASRWLRV